MLHHNDLIYIAIKSLYDDTVAYHGKVAYLHDYINLGSIEEKEDAVAVAFDFGQWFSCCLLKYNDGCWQQFDMHNWISVFSKLTSVDSLVCASLCFANVLKLDARPIISKASFPESISTEMKSMVHDMPGIFKFNQVTYDVIFDETSYPFEKNREALIKQGLPPIN